MFGLAHFFVFCVSVKIKLLPFHYYVFVCMPEKAISEMTYTVSGATLNPTHSLTRYRTGNMLVVFFVKGWAFCQITCWHFQV